MKKTEILRPELIELTLAILVDFGGPGSVTEINDAIAEEYSDEVRAVIHNPDIGTKTELAYESAWARTYLKKAGYLENPARRVWTLTDVARKKLSENGKLIVNGEDIIRLCHQKTRGAIALPEPIDDWKEKLLGVLTNEISLDAFGRLMRKMLREAGFTHVEVTGHASNQGIDGTGILKVNGLIGCRVAFQCKKRHGSIGASEIQKFRGGMGGRADRGIFVSTGTFTKAATEDAARALPFIDLIDGDDVAEMLKKFSLGVTTEHIERVSVDPTWFQSL